MANQCEVKECFIEDGKTVHITISGCDLAEGSAMNICRGCFGEDGQSGRYELCEFYYFRHPLLRPGFRQANGELIEEAAAIYPKVWAYLQTPEGRMLCKSEEEWQAMSTAVWATLPDGTEVGWNGVGGVPFYALNLESGTLRLPDLRGMYAEGSGFDGLEVGDVHGDAIRNLEGSYGRIQSYPTAAEADGVLYAGPSSPLGGHTGTSYQGQSSNLLIDASRQVPVANQNQPRAWGALACVYLGLPGQP